MNRRVSVILVIALVVSAAVSYVVYRRVAARVAAPAEARTTPVIVASRNLEIGTLIKDADLKVGSWSGAAPKGVAVKKEDIVGRGVIAVIYEGEPIHDSRLAPAGAGGGLAATIPPGMRACAVRVNEIVGVAGFVVPGMRVDVLISGAPSGRGSAHSGPDVRVKTLLQNIEVLSAGQNYQKDAEGKPVVVPVVNLLVTPEQAEILSLASNETRIQLVLRNPLDTQVAKTSGVAVASLFGDEVKRPSPASAARPRVVPVVHKAPEAAPPPATYVIEIINGPKRAEVKFPRRLEERQ